MIGSLAWRDMIQFRGVAHKVLVVERTGCAMGISAHLPRQWVDGVLEICLFVHGSRVDAEKTLSIQAEFSPIIINASV